MPVPAFRNSRSRVRRRRSHLALKPIRVTIDAQTGEMVLPHHEKATATAPEAVKKTKKAAKPAKANADQDHDHDHEGHAHA